MALISLFSWSSKRQRYRSCPSTCAIRSDFFCHTLNSLGNALHLMRLLTKVLWQLQLGWIASVWVIRSLDWLRWLSKWRWIGFLDEVTLALWTYKTIEASPCYLNHPIEILIAPMAVKLSTSHPIFWNHSDVTLIWNFNFDFSTCQFFLNPLLTILDYSRLVSKSRENREMSKISRNFKNSNQC